MSICDNCGKRFDLKFEEEEFAMETGMSLKNGNHFDKKLCAECAIEAYQNKEYYDNCENCGKHFYVRSELDELRMQKNNYDIDFSDMGEILCAECAYEKLSDLEEGIC